MSPVPVESQPAGTIELSYNPAGGEDARYEAHVGAVYAAGSTAVHALAKLSEKLGARLERHAEQAAKRR